MPINERDAVILTSAGSIEDRLDEIERAIGNGQKRDGQLLQAITALERKQIALEEHMTHIAGSLVAIVEATKVAQELAAEANGWDGK